MRSVNNKSSKIEYVLEIIDYYSDPSNLIKPVEIKYNNPETCKH